MPGNCDPPKEHRFSSTNQPDPAKKRVPKWKTRFIKMLNDPKNLQAFEEQIGKGNVKAWALLFERACGKVKDKIEHSGKVETTNINSVIDDIRKSLRKDDK